MWTMEQKLDLLMRLPWTVQKERTPEGDDILRIRELPGVSGAGAEEAGREGELWASLRSRLAAHLEFGDAVPMPEGAALPWASDTDRPVATWVLQTPDEAPTPRDGTGANAGHVTELCSM